MKDYLNEIDSRFPVRNSEQQKEAFRSYAVQEAVTLGYSASAKSLGTKSTGEHRNIVIGDPKNARVVFTAHYDTPRRALVPNMLIPLNPVLKWIYVFIPVLVMLAVAIGAGHAARELSGLKGFPGRLVLVLVYLAVYLALFLLILRGACKQAQPERQHLRHRCRPVSCGKDLRRSRSRVCPL